MSSAQMPTTAFPQLGRYQIVQKLGEGGMGAVYLAQDTQLSRQVAVKILPPHSVNNPDAIARFQREARALAQLSHPNIIQAFDFGSENGQHFLVMEYVEGQSLAALLQENGPLPPARAAAYIHQAALALEHAHEKGLIHRDLKPSNLLVTKDGQVKLLDLGLSRFLQDQLGDASQTREGVGMGTPDYAPPEQFRDAHNVDHRADIYSLGCTLYHLLTGRVPFPGSSLSDKYTAHATKEPTALAEFGIEVPAGLALTLEKMMAKNPAQRFQTARELAAAVAGFVSTSSSSFAQFKSTASWHMGQLTMTEFPRRRRWLPWALVGVVSLAAAALLTLVLTDVLRPRTQQIAQDNSEHTKQPDDAKKPDDKKPDPKEPEGKKPNNQEIPAAVAPDPNILTVSKEEKDGGQFRTIAEALRKVKRAQTIRVLDDAVYPEQLLINRSEHTGIRLEAPRQAVLEWHDGSLIEVESVRGVTLSGFQFRGAHAVVADNGLGVFLYVHGDCAGLVVERLTIDGPRLSRFSALEFHDISSKSPGEAGLPILIRNNVIRTVEVGVQVSGCLFSAYDKPTPVEGLVIRDNVLEDCKVGILTVGQLRRVQFVGNRILGASLVGIQLENLLEGTEDVLIANNTLVDCRFAIRDWDKAIRGKNLQIRNNLVLTTRQYDFTILDSGGRHEVEPKAGNGAGVAALWRLDHNWREGRKPSGNNQFDKGWIPPTETDVLREKIDGYDDDPKVLHFLRPKKDSDLASKGAGNEEPSLPRYVGAVPPEGVEPWDWERTWLAWPGTTKLLTVTQKEEDGGKYRNISDALEKAKPWDTIRVLDGATYEEAITLDEKSKHEGVRLEAVKGAHLHLGPTMNRLLTIRNVPHVQVSGFQLSGAAKPGEGNFQLVSLSGDASGVLLSRLQLAPGQFTGAILCQNVVADTTGSPLRLRECWVRATGENPFNGIAVIGTREGKGTRGVQVAGCRINGKLLKGVLLKGLVSDVQVVGNQICNCSQGGLQTDMLDVASTRVLLANNSIRDCGNDYRHNEDDLQEPLPKHCKGQVEFTNNLLLYPVDNDAAYLQWLQNKDKPGSVSMRFGDADELQRLWRFRRNYRDKASGSTAQHSLPLTAEEHLLDVADLESINRDTPDRLRPKKGTALAIEGAGVADASLPVYVGALPPEGVEAWNWDWTWHARRPREVLSKKQ